MRIKPVKIKEPVSEINKLTLLPWNLNTLFLIILIIGVILVLMPLALITVLSFSPMSSIQDRGYTFFPTHFTLHAYEYLFKTGDQLFQSYTMTILYTLTGTAISVTVMTLLAYVLSVRNFSFRKPLTWYMLFTAMFGGGLIPFYLLNVRYLQIKDTFWVVIFGNVSIGLVDALYVVILRTFIKTSIPESLYESARIDGAGHFTAFVRIVLPLMKAGIASIALFVMIRRWNDWLTTLLLTDSPKLASLQQLLIEIQSKIDYLKQSAAIARTPDGLQVLRQMPDENLRMAITLFIAIPILAAYPFFQRYFVAGLTIGSVKE